MGGELLELLVVADGKLDVLGENRLLVVLSSTGARQLQELHAHVLEHTSHEDASGGTNSIAEAACSDVASAASRGEDESGLLLT